MIENNYLSAIVLTQTTPCLADPDRIIITGKPSRPLDDVLPYLASLPDVMGFNPDSGTLTFRRPKGFMTLYSRRIVITQVKDEAEAEMLLDTLTEAVNATWENRHSLKPVQTRKKPPGHLDLYALLPQTNCKVCGETTCLAFAVGLVTGARSVEECGPLGENPEYKDRLQALEAIL